MSTSLAKYDAACAALAEAMRIDEVKDIVDKAVAIAAYARQANDRTLEANAVELRERATRRLGQLLAEDKKAGRISPGQPPKKNGTDAEPFFSRTTLAEIGVDKKLSSQSQRKAALSETEFEGRLSHMHTKVAEGKSPSDALRDKERQQGAESRRNLAQTLSDKSVTLSGGRRFPVIYADPPWRRNGGIGNRSYENHYPTMTWAQILALPVEERALPDAWLYLWMPRAHAFAPHKVMMTVRVDGKEVEAEVWMPLATAIANHFGFPDYSTCFVWTKTDGEHPDDHGMGLVAWDQDELLLLFKRGSGLPKPPTDKLHGSNHRERATKHSAKPLYYRELINDMAGGLPVLELFGRKPEPDEPPLPKNWTMWGNQA